MDLIDRINKVLQTIKNTLITDEELNLLKTQGLQDGCSDEVLIEFIGVLINKRGNADNSIERLNSYAILNNIRIARVEANKNNNILIGAVLE